jgi:hypothetical protein
MEREEEPVAEAVKNENGVQVVLVGSSVVISEETK